MESERSNRQRPVWRNRDYLLLWSGQLISATGNQVSQLAFPLLVLALTHSPTQAGITAALRALPYLIFSLPAGAFLDRWNRKWVMILCDLGRACCMVSVPLVFVLGSLTIYQLDAVALVEGTLFVFFNIAEVACLPNVVSKEQLPAAVAQNEVALYITTLVGPFLSGLLYTLQRLLPFIADAISYLFSVCSLLLIKTPFQQERQRVTRSLRAEMQEGLHWLWKHPLIRFLALISAGSNLLSSSYILFIIVLAQQMKASNTLIGLIITMGGVGGIIGAFLAPFVQKRFSFWQIMTIGTWIWAILTGLYIIAPHPLLLGSITFALFLLWPICNTAQMSYRLALIPDHLQGRVNSVFRLIALSGQPVGLLITGWGIEEIGAGLTIGITAIGLVFVAFCFTMNPHVRSSHLQTNK
jgi:predicted MFS family arabinose efflux permease